MRITPLERKISDIIDPVIADLGFDLIQVRMIGTPVMQTLQIIAEDPETGLMDLNGCTAISRAVSAVLDVEDPVTAAYNLEISSPGVDRPLVREKDFAKYKGYDVAVEIDMPNEENKKRFRGILENFENNTIFLTVDGAVVEISFDDVLRAKLVMTETLVNNGKPKGQKKILNKKTKQSKPTKDSKKTKTLESEEV